jgi:hypothetical protein
MNDGTKNDQDKPRLDLLSPAALLLAGQVLSHGAAKYGSDNWRKVPDGQNRYYAAAMRHLLAWKQGERVDQESGLSHLAHALTCITFLIEFEDRKKC